MITRSKKNYIFNLANGHCYYCNIPCKQHKSGRKNRVKENTATIDHIIPIDRGGTNTDSNLVLSCHQCNRRKSNKLLETFRKNTVGSGNKFPGELIQFTHIKEAKPMKNRKLPLDCSQVALGEYYHKKRISCMLDLSVLSDYSGFPVRKYKRFENGCNISDQPALERSYVLTMQHIRNATTVAITHILENKI